MSGIKSAEVKHGLNKTIAYVRRQAESCNNAAASIGGVGALNSRKKGQKPSPFMMALCEPCQPKSPNT